MKEDVEVVDQKVFKDLTVCQEQSRGRYIQATAAIPAGTVLWREKALVTDINPETSGALCHNCARRVVAVVPCPYCCSSQYCSATCLHQSWNSYHWLECWIHRTTDMPVLSQEARIALRVLLSTICHGCEKGGLESSLSSPDSARDGPIPLCNFKPSTSEEKQLLVKSLVTHADHRQAAVHEFRKEADQVARCVDSVFQPGRRLSPVCVYSEYLDLAPSFRDVLCSTDTSSSSSRDRGALCCSENCTVDSLSKHLLHTMLILQCNGHAITATMTEADLAATQASSSVPDSSRTLPVATFDNTAGAAMSGGASCSVEAKSQVRLALAIFPLTALLNHSCVPNTLVRFDGNVISVVSDRDINAGCEVTHCYGVDAIRSPDTDKRSQALSKQYFFQCKCLACENGDAAEERLAACSSGISADRIKLMSAEVATLMDRGTSLRDAGKLTESVDCLQRAVTLQRQYLPENDISLGYTHDCLANVFYQLGDCATAVQHSSLSLAVVQSVYGKYSMQAASEHFKLCQLLFNSGDASQFLQVSGDGVAVMKQALGDSHDDTVELMEMRRFVRASAR
eukprot:scpid46411/ scgid6096/ SET and MYND domain-containing protein 4